MNIIEKRQKEIEELQKGCGKFLYQYEESNYPQGCDGAKLCNETLRLCNDCKTKLQILKKILAEEKEFVKRLKEEINKYNRGFQVYNKDYFDIIDNISIHSLHKEDNLGEVNTPLHNEPDDSNAKLVNSGSSNLCKNCGKTESEHPVHEFDDIHGEWEFECKKFEPQELFNCKDYKVNNVNNKKSQGERA